MFTKFSTRVKRACARAFARPLDVRKEIKKVLFCSGFPFFTLWACEWVHRAHKFVHDRACGARARVNSHGECTHAHGDLLSLVVAPRVNSI